MEDIIRKSNTTRIIRVFSETPGEARLLLHCYALPIEDTCLAMGRTREPERQQETILKGLAEVWGSRELRASWEESAHILKRYARQSHEFRQDVRSLFRKMYAMAQFAIVECPDRLREYGLDHLVESIPVPLKF
jgi:hypothetical protein